MYYNSKLPESTLPYCMFSQTLLPQVGQVYVDLPRHTGAGPTVCYNNLGQLLSAKRFLSVWEENRITADISTLKNLCII